MIIFAKFSAIRKKQTEHYKFQNILIYYHLGINFSTNGKTINFELRKI